MLQTSTIAEQVAVHLRDGIGQRRWTGQMPGRSKLADELGVNVKTVERALAKLEAEGLLQSQGPGRRRRIVASQQPVKAAMQVKLVLYESNDAVASYILELRRALESAGHRFSFARKTLVELKQDPQRIARMMQSDTAEIWILVAAARPVLEHFAKLPIPVFALFGRVADLPLAAGGPEKAPLLSKALHRLVDLGHRRIILLTRKERRHPAYGPLEQIFLEELKKRGIASGSYNIPEWEESAEGLRHCLDLLFQFTPPTAIIVSDAQLCLAIRNYLAGRRGRDLRNVAMVCTDYDTNLDWCAPPIAHFRWDRKPLVRLVVRWVNRVAAGKDDRRQTLTPMQFVGAETLQPVDAEVRDV